MNSDVVTHPSCQEGNDSAVSYTKARELVESNVRTVAGHEMLALRSALGRVLARPVMSPADVPPHRNSAMDGYALSSTELPAQSTETLQVVGTAWAGAPYQGSLDAGQCVRIMTGAKVPEAADTVVIQEQVERLDDDRVRIGSGHKPGQNVRHPGEDIARGQDVLPTGKRIAPAELGLLSSLGIAELCVHRRVRVAFFSSGDELRSVGQPLDEGMIYDSNRYTLYGMLAELGVEILDFGVVPDRDDALEETLGTAAATADMVLTTGGISVGDADRIRQLLVERGEILFSKVALKPGRPVTFARWGESWLFGLPGNPVAAMTAFYQFARPAIRRLQGESATQPLRFRVRTEDSLRKAPGRTELPRGVLFYDDDGELWVRTTGRQGSGILSSMSLGNCFIFLQESLGSVSAGDMVTVEPFQMVRF